MLSPRVRDQRELSTQGFRSHALRRVLKLNDTLRRTRALVAKSGDDAANSLALLLAETRVLVLRMGRHQFGRKAGMHFHAVKNVETPGSHPQHESFSRVYRTWLELAAEEHGPSSRTHTQLTAACTKLLDLLVPAEDDHGRPWRATIDGLYRTWMYQQGHEAFDAASRKTNRLRVPLTYGTLWQRHEVGMVPDFEEVRVIGSLLGRDLEHAAAIWEPCKTAQLLARGVPQPLVRFIVAIQLGYPGLRMVASSLRKHLQVSEYSAQAINNGELIKFDEIRTAAQAVIPRKEIPALQREWNAAWDRAASQEDFSTAFPRICAENGWTNHMLSTLLRVRPPEERSVRSTAKRKGKNNSRTESYRPSAEVRRMYQENCFSGQAPAMAAIALVTNESTLEPSGENQRDYLVRLFLEGVDRRLTWKGSSAQGSVVRGHRILCGVTPGQLADASGDSQDEILLLERGIREATPAKVKRLVRLIESFPAVKVNEARARLAELASPPTTVRQAAERMRDRCGGFIPLARLLSDETDRRLSFTPARLKRIAYDEDVPPLPLLKSLVTRGGMEVTPELVRDWYNRMPTYLADHSPLQWKHPLARGFGIVIFEQWQSLHRFWEEQLREDFSYSMVTRNFQQLNGSGIDMQWTAASRYLNAAGVGISDPRRTFLQRLFHRGSEITNTIDTDDRPAYLAIIGETLKQWRKEERAARRDPKSIEHTLGLTPAELA